MLPMVGVLILFLILYLDFFVRRTFNVFSLFSYLVGIGHCGRNANSELVMQPFKHPVTFSTVSFLRLS